jgi:hypothetical protein
MELVEIRSSHDLTANVPENRGLGVHSYLVHCRQFVSVQREWERNRAVQGQALGLMTLALERIWITEKETKQVAAAIQSARSPVVLE